MGLGRYLVVLVLAISTDVAQQHNPEGRSQSKVNKVVPIPSNIVDPDTLSTLDESQFSSLLSHGYARTEYGKMLSVYGRPACEHASWFLCYDTAVSSDDGIRKWLQEAISCLKKAIELRPTDKSAYIILMDALLSKSDLSASLDLYEQHWIRPELSISLQDRINILNKIHVLSTRNCRWGASSRAHHLITGLVRNESVSMPAMHWVEIPGVTAVEAMENMKLLSDAVEHSVADDLVGLAKRTKKTVRRSRASGTQQLVIGYVSGKGFQQYTTTDALLGLFLARERSLFRVVRTNAHVSAVRPLLSASQSELQLPYILVQAAFLRVSSLQALSPSYSICREITNFGVGPCVHAHFLDPVYHRNASFLRTGSDSDGAWLPVSVGSRCATPAWARMGPDSEQ